MFRIATNARGRAILGAVVALSALVASETLLFAQDGPPGGRQRGERGERGGGGMGRGMGGGMGGMGRGMQDVREVLEADFQRRDIPIFVRQLNLTEDQGVVLETLFVDYEASFQPEAEAIMTSMADMGRNLMRSFATPERQQQMRDMTDSIRREIEEAEAANGPMDEEARRNFFRERMQKMAEQFAADAQASGLDAEVKAVMGDMLRKLEAWSTRKNQLRDDFSAGLKVVLDDDQVAQWPAFERFLTREKTLPRGRISGENVNLFLVVDELRLPPAEFTKLEPLFDAYETRLDDALRTRNTYIEQSLPRLFEAMQTGDSGAAGRIFKRQSELRGAVRDVNEEYRTAMVAALGETDWARQLDAAILEGGWERIYRPTGTDRAFREAIGFEDLDPTVLASIEELYTQYKGEIAPINERLKSMARTEEPSRLVTEGERFVSMMSQGVSGMALGAARGGQGFGAPEADPMREVFEQRSDVGERYLERLRALLTPEQIERLPRTRGQGGARGGFGGGQGGAEGMQGMLERLPEEQRRQLLQAVDRNGNGQIDEDEREGLRQYMREQFNNFRNNGGGGGGGGAGGRGGRGGAGDA
jgi:hypothetical protein